MIHTHTDNKGDVSNFVNPMGKVVLAVINVTDGTVFDVAQ